MHHIILDSTLTTRDESPHPLCVPTSGLTYAAMMAMLDLSKKEVGAKVTAFIGPAASLRMERLLDPDQFRDIARFFDIRTDHLPPRYDFVKFFWEQRHAGTIQYAAAAYEDAIFAYPQDKPFAVLRFQRGTEFDGDKIQPCWSNPTPASPCESAHPIQP